MRFVASRWWFSGALALGLAGCVSTTGPGRARRAPPPVLSHEAAQAAFDAAPNRFPLDFGHASAEALEVRKLLPPHFEDVAKHVGFLLELPRDVPIHVLTCGSMDAFYAHQTQDIVICDELLTELAKLEPDARSFRAAVIFCVMHEVAHALVHQLGLRVEGIDGASGETWADLYGSLMFSETQLRIGTDSAARFFRTLARSEHHDPDDGHLPSNDRAVAVLCVYEGSEPGARPACRDLHDLAKARWNQWLRPFSRVQGGDTF